MKHFITLRGIKYAALVAVILMAGPMRGKAQYFSWGEDPSGIEWRSIETEHFRLVFPQDFSLQAHRVAHILEASYPKVAQSLGHFPRKIPVLIHNQGVVSNGFVGWAPRRVELFSQPPSDNESVDWLEHLVIHELRHVVQVDKLNQGLTRALGILLGEQATAAVAGVFLPFWFLEGDAVAIETALSKGGRGEIPEFERSLKAQILEKGPYSVEKAMFGSYRDFVPNHYELGYFMVAHARLHYDVGVWDDVLTRVGRSPLPLAFNRALKKNTGLGTTKLYKETFTHLDSVWRNDPFVLQSMQVDTLNPSNKIFSNYFRPQHFEEQGVVALKTGKATIPRIVRINANGKERILHTPGYIDYKSLHTAAGRLVWCERIPDSRWEHRSWSDIFLLDKGKLKRLSFKQKFFSPALSPDGQRIVVTEASADYRFSLVILDAENGEELSRFSDDANAYLMQPSWATDMKSIWLIRQNSSGKALVRLNLQTGAFEEVFHAGHTEISMPVEFNNRIYFNAAFSGSEQIHALNPETGENVRITAMPFGASDISQNKDGNTVFSFYTSHGLQIGQMTGSWTQEHLPPQDVYYHNGIAARLREQESMPDLSFSLPDTSAFVDKPYSKWNGLLKPHSWGPLFPDVATNEIRPGASLLFQNLHSTSILTMGYDYDWQMEQGSWRLNYAYRGWYPVLEVDAFTGKRTNSFKINEQLTPVDWQRSLARLRASVPQFWVKGAYVRRFTPSLSLRYQHAGPRDNTPAAFVPSQTFSLEYRLYFAILQRMSERDMRSPKGFGIDINYLHPISQSLSAGQVFSATALLLSPGLTRHHSLRLGSYVQWLKAPAARTGSIQFQYVNQVALPRGRAYPIFQQAYGGMLDYKFPFWYPDLSIPYVLYLKRAKLNLFFDYAYALSGNEFNAYSAAGLDLSFDMHLMRFLSPIDAGVRLGQNLQDGKLFYSFFYGINF